MVGTYTSPTELSGRWVPILPMGKGNPQGVFQFGMLVHNLRDPYNGLLIMIPK